MSNMSLTVVTARDDPVRRIGASEHPGTSGPGRTWQSRLPRLPWAAVIERVHAKAPERLVKWRYWSAIA